MSPEQIGSSETSPLRVVRPVDRRRGEFARVSVLPGAHRFGLDEPVVSDGQGDAT